MSRTRPFAYCFAAAAATLASALVQVPAATAAEKLIYATYITDAYSATRTDVWFMKEVEKLSNGEIKFETYWASSLLKAADLFPGLAKGAADLAATAPAAYNPREYPLAHIVMPFLTTKGDALTLAWNELLASNADFRKQFESKGLKVLYGVSWAENTVWSKRPIAKVDDFKGLKVRAIPPISDALQRLGATPVALAWPDGLEGLQRGVIEAMSAAPFDSAVVGNVQEVAKFGTDAGGTGPFAMAVMAIGADRYKKLSEAHRKIIDEVAKETPAQGVRLLNESVDAAVTKLCGMKEKLTISNFPAAEIEKVQKLAAQTLQADFIKKAETEAKADGKAMLEQFKTLLKKHEASSTYEPGFERYRKKCG
jgi:TRAP-type C4-dicarboxylate transport system substrate-binding protein